MHKICVLLFLALAGCGTGAPVGPVASVPRGSTASETQKTITVGALNSVKGFSPWLIGTTGGGARSLTEAHTAALVSRDISGGLEPRLAERLPSFEDRTIVVLPDGRMRTTWKMRSNVKWHDGALLTAADIVLSWRVQTHAEIPSGGGQVRQRLELVEAVDLSTVVMTWTTTFSNALQLGATDLWPLPEHLLGPAFDGDKDAFLNLPYWTTEYVHLGPFRVVDFGLGENLILQRFDDYFLGRPQVDRIIIRIIPDANTALINLKAGALDIITENALSADLGARLRDEWLQSGDGTVVSKQGNWRFINIQHNPDYGRPAELRTDMRARRGLLLSLDRDAIREVMTPGFPNTEPDSFMPISDPRAPLAGRPFARYRLDPTAATQDLADAGWRRAPVGHMLNQAGEALVLDVRVTSNAARELAIVAQSWRAFGFEVNEEVIPGSLAADRPYRATFPGMEITAQGNGDSILTRFDGRQCPRPPRFSGSQGGCYMNTELDRLMDMLFATIDVGDQGLALREIGELMAAELPALPMYFDVNVAAIRRGIRAMVDDFGGSGTGSVGYVSRNAHLWDRN